MKIRLEEALRAQLEKSAKQQGLSLNAEIRKRLYQSFEWERAFAEPKKMVEQDFQAAMLQKGYQLYHTIRGSLWASYKIDAEVTDLFRSAEAATLVRAMEPALVSIVEKAMAKVATRGDKE
jgi:hypothetical protein